MDELDFYFMRMSAIHHELALVADRMGRLAVLGRGNDSDTAFDRLEKRRKELNDDLLNLQSRI